MSETAPLFLEIGVEDLPARFVDPACQDFRDAVARVLEAARIPHGELEVLGTPRRLVVHAKGVAVIQETVTERKLGPPKSKAYDGDGKLTPAAVGFAKRLGVAPGALRVFETPKGEYVGVEVEEGGRPVRTVLAEMLPATIAGLGFPKSMRWGSHDLRFGRPVRWIVALLGEDVIRFELAGVVSASRSRGHRTLAPQEFEVRGFEEYAEYLESKGFVVVSPERRRRRISDGLHRLAQLVGGRVVEAPDLLDEVVNLVEFPSVVVGDIEERFLELPREVLIAEMRDHQRYFAVEDDAGHLLPKFLCVTNMPIEDLDKITRGNERVLRARLSDGGFFYREDLKTSLDAMAERLRGVVFQGKLGTVWDKRERVIALADVIAKAVGLKAAERDHLLRAAALCKADLVSQMVGEFPELQGVMGKYYARQAGEPEVVAQAIEEHYRPHSSGDAPPRSLVGAVLSVADRLDTLMGFFAIGKSPSGAADPFALRRHGLAVLAILLDRGWSARVSALIALAAKTYEGAGLPVTAEARAQLEEFIATRLRGVFTGEGCEPDVVDAVLSRFADEPTGALARARALQEMKGAPGFEDLAGSFKRVANISKDHAPGPVDPSRFEDPSERALHDACEHLEAVAAKKAAVGDYAGLLSDARALKAPVDAFFDGVMVMCEDEGLRTNRLNLLARVGGLFALVADFSKIRTAK
ncbi:MAG: glycine--tRNA ligase subunit beta [Myxococcales bacterium]|nr:glycine--tRNA ligase subunit beta [Myxococcales bacterium]